MPAEPEAARAAPRNWVAGWIERVGRKVLAAVQHAGHFGILLAATIGALPQIRRYWPAALVHAKRIGVDGVVLVIVVGGLSGSLLAQQTGYQLSNALPMSLVGSGVVAGMLTELGPVLTAIVIAGRTGAGIGAELGTMKVTDQIDALVTLGRDPVVELVAPRVVGGIIALIPLVIIANFVGIFAGWFTAVSLLPMSGPDLFVGQGADLRLHDHVHRLLRRSSGRRGRRRRRPNGHDGRRGDHRGDHGAGRDPRSGV
jgi:phospholipid/cholesterol/gamma-HCH transport system permease protein